MCLEQWNISVFLPPLTPALPSTQVCDCQQQFARREEGEQVPLPCFGGRQGAEVTRSLLEVEAAFDKSIQTLRSVRKGILDVKNTSWHDDYNRCQTSQKTAQKNSKSHPPPFSSLPWGLQLRLKSLSFLSLSLCLLLPL